MWAVTFVIRICWKVHSIVTNKRTRRMHSNVKCVIMFKEKQPGKAHEHLRDRYCASQKRSNRGIQLWCMWKDFTEKAYLTQHKRTHAVRKTLKEFDCKLCEKVYASNQKLGKHVEKAHPNPRRVEDANVGFMVFEYPMHSVTVNQKKKILKCKQCNYESGRKLNLKRHIESHTANWSAKETTRRTIFCHKKNLCKEISKSIHGRHEKEQSWERNNETHGKRCSEERS